jgi:hypothetical protein
VTSPIISSSRAEALKEKSGNIIAINRTIFSFIGNASSKGWTGEGESKRYAAAIRRKPPIKQS